MSRCFPFPPPGYEREHTPEDLALLKEVKHKDKKHKKEKKEKKDKERRKDKEKKEKDESVEKQRDKKDRKGKHKDKKEKHKDKKDKEDRGKDKDKSSISEESTVAGKLEERSGEKLHPKGHPKVSSLADEGKCFTFFQAQNGGKPQSSQATNEARFVLELDRRIRDEENGGGSRKFPERVASVDKRGYEETSGIVDSEKIRPNKVQSVALNQSRENGRKLEASQISTKSSSDKHLIPNHVRLDLDLRNRLSNGVIEAPKPSTSKPNSFTRNMVSNHMVVASKTTHLDFSNVNKALKVSNKMKDHTSEEAPRRAPHPDSKYLSQVFTVPKMGDWSESDDQEWLFSKKGPPKRAHLELPGVNEEPRVWSEAVHIESCDMYALPYVNPY